jgi:hypothetical protein
MVPVFPGSEHQRPEGKLSALRELYAEGPMSHGLPGWILSASLFLSCLCRRIIVR